MDNLNYNSKTNLNSKSNSTIAPQFLRRGPSDASEELYSRQKSGAGVEQHGSRVNVAIQRKKSGIMTNSRHQNFVSEFKEVQSKIDGFIMRAMVPK
jgi:hypothetical protein